MNYKQYNKNQNPTHINRISIFYFILTVGLIITVEYYRKVTGNSIPYAKLIYPTLTANFQLSLINLFTETTDFPLRRFIKKEKVIYFPTSKVITLPGFNSTHFLENTYTSKIFLENKNFETPPLLEKIKIKNKDYVAFTKKIKLTDNSDRNINYLVVDSNDNYITEIPKDFKYIKPETKIFKYHIKYNKRGFLPIIENITPNN